MIRDVMSALHADKHFPSDADAELIVREGTDDDVAFACCCAGFQMKVLTDEHNRRERAKYRAQFARAA